MTDSGDNGTLPQGWAIAALEDLVASSGVLTDGDWIESKDQDTNGDVRLVQLADVGEGQFLDKSDRYLTLKKSIELNCTYLKRGDVLISRLGDPLGKSCIYPGRESHAVTAVDVCIFRSGNGDLDHRWLMHAINSPQFRASIEAESSGTTRKRISGGKLRQKELWLAPANEQRRIVAKIDELFSDIEEGERCLARAEALLKRYRQSVLKAAVTGDLTRDWRAKNKGKGETGADLLRRILATRREAWGKNGRSRQYVAPAPVEPSNLPRLPETWAWATLEQLAAVVGGITVDKKRDGKDFEEVPYLRVANVQRGYLDLREVKTIRAEKSRVDALALEAGDILFNEGGDRDKIGRGWIWQAQIPRCIHQNHVFRARLYSKDVPSEFVSHYANEMGREFFMVQGKQTTNLASISLSKISKLPIPLAPMDEMRAAVDLLAEMLTTADRLGAELRELTRQQAELRQSILRAAFSGKLVPQDPSDEPASALLARIAAVRAPALTAKPQARRR